jgi:hypothetical protein
MWTILKLCPLRFILICSTKFNGQVLCLGPARKGKCKTKVLHLRGAKILFLKMLSYCSKKKEQNGLCCIIREKLLKINTIKFKNKKLGFFHSLLFLSPSFPPSLISVYNTYNMYKIIILLYITNKICNHIFLEVHFR